MKLLFFIALLFSSEAFAEYGIVKSFSFDKGYGFIRIPGQSDIFVHVNAVESSGIETLIPGQCLTFDIIPKRDGREVAENLILINCQDLKVSIDQC